MKNKKISVEWNRLYKDLGSADVSVRVWSAAEGHHTDQLKLQHGVGKFIYWNLMSSWVKSWKTEDSQSSLKIIVRFEVKSKSHIEKVKKPSKEQLKMLVVWCGVFCCCCFPLCLFHKDICIVVTDWPAILNHCCVCHLLTKWGHRCFIREHAVCPAFW